MMAKEPVQYSDQQKKLILDFWNSRKENPPSLGEMMSLLSNGETEDVRRSPFGPILRKILSEASIKPRTKVHEKVEGIILNSDQKLFILNNCEANSPYELGKTLFPSDTKLQPLGREVRAVVDYLKEMDRYIPKKEDGTMPEGKYVPPRTFHHILAKVNLYLHEELTNQNVTAFEKKCLETTIQFLHSPRFVQEINNYLTVEKRISFESEFIRAVYGKIDLQPEEVSLTINFCNDVLQAADLRKLLEQLHNKLNSISEDENGKYSQSLAVSIGEVTTNLNEILKRQERVYSLLNKSRAKRDEEKTNRTANLAQLFEWFRDEENRKKAVKQAELIRENRKNEVKREENLSDTILLCLGMSAESI